MTAGATVQALGTVATIKVEMAFEALARGKALPAPERLALARELVERGRDLVHVLETLAGLEAPADGGDVDRTAAFGYLTEVLEALANRQSRIVSGD